MCNSFIFTFALGNNEFLILYRLRGKKVHVVARVLFGLAGGGAVRMKDELAHGKRFTLVSRHRVHQWTHGFNAGRF